MSVRLRKFLLGTWSRNLAQPQGAPINVAEQLVQMLQMQQQLLSAIGLLARQEWLVLGPGCRVVFIQDFANPRSFFTEGYRILVWLVVWNHGILWLSIHLGMSSSQVTNSIIFQRGGEKPPTSYRWETHDGSRPFQLWLQEPGTDQAAINLWCLMTSSGLYYPIYRELYGIIMVQCWNPL